MFRNVNAYIVGWFLRYTGITYRFDKSWRHGETKFREFVYNNIICTFAANIIADGGKWFVFRP